MLNLFKPLLLAIALAFLAGCAATVNQTPLTLPASAPRALTSNAAFVAVITADSKVQVIDDWQAFLLEWQQSLGTAAAAASIPFVFVKDEAMIPSNASILIRLNVNDFKYVSTLKRFMLGIMAGNANMDVDVQYVEIPANKLLISKKFNTTSSAWEGIFSAVTPRQIQAVSEVIIKDAMASAPAK